jgi:cytochrome c-type biogenesis protein CcmH
LIGEAEAEAARVEISRRLLAAAEPPTAGSAVAERVRGTGHRRVAAIVALVVLVLGPLGLYIALGSPNVPGEPAFARIKTPLGHDSIASLVGQVEARLAANPNDGAGWEVIAPVYARLGRFDDAVKARQKALALNGDTAAREADLGEAETAAANGIVTATAKATFDRAVARDPKEAKARYFLGLAAEQDGRSNDAATIWRTMLAEAPPGAPWVGFVTQALARVSGTQVAATEPSAADVSASAEMSDDARRDMIRGMVARLAERLHGNGADIEGWLRLVRAYTVLGERAKAKDAAAEARRVLSERPDDVRRVDDLVKGLGLEG